VAQVSTTTGSLSNPCLSVVAFLQACAHPLLGLPRVQCPWLARLTNAAVLVTLFCSVLPWRVVSIWA
jgi:hypothetical protein